MSRAGSCARYPERSDSDAHEFVFLPCPANLAIAAGDEATYYGTPVHQSFKRNNNKAIEVRDWLAKSDWDDVFLDLNPERGIVAGQRWKDTLQKATECCEMVLALISAERLASPWCKAEIDAARLMGKKVIIALIGIDKARCHLT